MVAYAAQACSADRGLPGACEEVPVWPRGCGDASRKLIHGSGKGSIKMTNRFFKMRIVSLCLVELLVLMPIAANAGVQDIISLLSTLTITLQNGVRSVLSGIQSIHT